MKKPGPTRRRIVAAAALVASGAALVAARPGDRGAPQIGYFAAMAQALKAAGVNSPTLVVDRVRLRANAAKVRAHVQGQQLALRLVNKSLPCLGLLDEVGAATASTRQMVFSLPYLALMAKERPRTDLLLGKPLPAAAAAAFLAAAPASGFDPLRQLQWLVDTPQRLAQYRELARGRGQPLRINFEIDVGLHRGGVADEETLRAMLQMVQEEPLLRFAGFMGYDAHTQKIPDLAGARERAHRHAVAAYQRCVDVLRAGPLPLAEPLTFNTAGSPTFRLHDGSGAANEVAVGSAMVMPSDFDTPLLADLQPAAWIATPVLKVGEFAAPDGVGALGRLARAWDANQRTAHFIHGGNWLADPVSPPGLSTSVLMGLSSNQQLLVGSGAQALRPDDMAFFRPRQSEAVLQQFGDIAVYDGGSIVDQWPVFPARA